MAVSSGFVRRQASFSAFFQRKRLDWIEGRNNRILMKFMLRREFSDNSVNYSALKRQVVAGQTPQDHDVGTARPSFVEVPVKAWPAAEDARAWVMELEDRAGCKLTVRMPPGESGAALTLAQALWRARLE